MVNEIGAIPAFKSVELVPTAPLSVSVLEWVSEGKIYSWNFTKTNSDFRANSLGPVYTAFADATTKGTATAKSTFISGMTAALETLKP
jgi:raffinose/stachyose/melibiose transport system substrate-binding protein